MSRRFTVDVSLAGHEIGDADIARVIDEAFRLPVPDDQATVHLAPIGYTVDGVDAIRDPRGLYGEQFGAIMHRVTAARGAVRNVSACVGRCHLEVDALVVSAAAAARAVLVEDELALGAVCVDMGAGATTIAAYARDQLVHADSVPVGGGHVTNDIAYGLSTTAAAAERLKTLHGNALPGGTDEREMLDVPEIGEGDRSVPNHVSRARLIEIIRPRIEETLEMVRDRLAAAGLADMGGRRVVLTGGASQLAGLREAAAQILDRPVRLGRPRAVRGLAESASGPAFAAVAGLLLGQIARDDAPIARRPSRREPALRLGRIGQWLRDNF